VRKRAVDIVPAAVARRLEHNPRFPQPLSPSSSRQPQPGPPKFSRGAPLFWASYAADEERIEDYASECVRLGGRAQTPELRDKFIEFAHVDGRSDCDA
jgi:hypothetical protein